MSIEQDFERTQEALNKLAGYVGIFPEGHYNVTLVSDALAALSRIEAENERLRKANGVLGQQLSKAFGDIEHLQEAYRIEQETHRRTASERDAALAEVERWEGGE